MYRTLFLALATLAGCAQSGLEIEGQGQRLDEVERRTGISLEAGEWMTFSVKLDGDPESDEFALYGMAFSLSHGSGNGDLLVKYGAAPTFDDNDCASRGEGNDELCTIDYPKAGTWFVTIYATGAVTDARLGSTVPGVTVYGQPEGAQSVLDEDISGSQGTYLEFDMIELDFSQRLTVVLFGGEGDADLTLESLEHSRFDCVSNAFGNEEYCQVMGPGAFVPVVHAWDTYSGVRIQAVVDSREAGDVVW